MREKTPNQTRPHVVSALRPDQTTELETAEPTQLGGVALRRELLIMTSEVAECRYTSSNPMRGTISFSLLLFAIIISWLTLNKS